MKGIEQMKQASINNIIDMTKKLRVENMNSPKSGHPVANQYIIQIGDDTEVFQSYSSIIGFVTYQNGEKQIVLDDYYWNYSRTTGKYRNQWLGEYIADTRAKIKSGEYQLADLN